MGDRVLRLGSHTQVVADLGRRSASFGNADVGTGQLHRGRPGLLHRCGKNLINGS